MSWHHGWANDQTYQVYCAIVGNPYIGFYWHTRSSIDAPDREAFAYNLKHKVLLDKHFYNLDDFSDSDMEQVVWSEIARTIMDNRSSII